MKTVLSTVSTQSCLHNHKLEKDDMRSDMKKVVVERPRSRSRQRNNKFGARLRYIPDHDYDDEPKKPRGFESYTAGSRKWFTDVLGPLAGFLRKNIGRPWDKVYSELCANLDKRKATGKHIFDHIKGMVQTKCFIGEDGRVWAIDWAERPVGGMYVHPRTGLLCDTPTISKRERRREREKAEASFLYLTDTFGYRKFEGIWYRVRLQRMSFNWKTHHRAPTIWDIFRKRWMKPGIGEHWIAVEKWQCGRAELAEIQRLLEKREGTQPERIIRS